MLLKKNKHSRKKLYLYGESEVIDSKMQTQKQNVSKKKQREISEIVKIILLRYTKKSKLINYSIWLKNKTKKKSSDH